jgi:hypothetical protein
MNRSRKEHREAKMTAHDSFEFVSTMQLLTFRMSWRTLSYDELGSSRCISQLGKSSRMFDVKRHIGLSLDCVCRDLELGIRFHRTFRAERRQFSKAFTRI